MVQNLFEVLSTQEIKVFKLKNENKPIKEIANILGCSPNTIKEYCKRIKKKITDLQLLDNVVLIYDQGNEIEEIFYEENTRSLPKKTVNQVQFLAESNRMSSKKRSPDAKRQMRRQTGTAKTVVTRMLTEEERLNLQITPAEIPDSSVTSAYTQYNNWYENPPDIESMAALELILRAHGLIYRTPYINQLNRKTSRVLRAQENGYQTVIVMPGEDKLIPQGSKYVERVKDEYGNCEYTTWLFPQASFYPKNKQKSKCD